MKTMDGKNHFVSHISSCEIRKTNYKKSILALESLTNFLVRSFTLKSCSILKANIPRDLCHLIAVFTVPPLESPLIWNKFGSNVKLSEDKLTAYLDCDNSGSVIADRSFNSGKYVWCIHVDIGHHTGCRYIGVVNSDNISLETNLQHGGSGHRVAWDGSCSKIYYDIASYTGFPAVAWTTNDAVQIEVDCDNKKISFYGNNTLVRTVDVSSLGNQTWTPVVGFGYSNGQSVTLCSITKKN